MINKKTCNCNNINSVRPRLPEWIRVKAHSGHGRKETDDLIKNLGLNTVCQSAKCPNIGECWHKKTATFMIMGNICTRNCKFCAVNHGVPEPLDETEPLKIAEAVKKLNLKYAVVTSVTRDDLKDGGAEHFAKVIKKIREINSSKTGIEVLTPDFNEDIESIKTVLDSEPTVFNHNIETVERLSADIRIVADYRRSLKVLKIASETSEGKIGIKSGLMVGLGETNDEVIKTIDDLYLSGVEILTIGQYLPPTSMHWPLARFVHPDEFKEWEIYAYKKGFKTVASGPLVRSSYNAEELNSKI